MRRELDYFTIGDSYGGNQDWFAGFMMRLGGCAAETVCDLCVYFAKYFGENCLYPYSLDPVRKKDYVLLADRIRPYLSPRPGGISSLSTYLDGLSAFFKRTGEERLHALPFSGDNSTSDAAQAVRSRIDSRYTVPCLTLRHSAKEMDDYIWHWYTLNAYDWDPETDRMSVKAVTYGEGKWLDFATLWNTGYKEKGGLIILSGL